MEISTDYMYLFAPGYVTLSYLGSTHHSVRVHLSQHYWSNTCSVVLGLSFRREWIHYIFFRFWCFKNSVTVCARYGRYVNYDADIAVFHKTHQLAPKFSTVFSYDIPALLAFWMHVVLVPKLKLPLFRLHFLSHLRKITESCSRLSLK